jgi:hypothetical protein
MIFESLLSLALIHNQPVITPRLYTPPIILAARIGGGYRSSRSSSSFRSYSSPSISRPIRSSSGNIVINQQKGFKSSNTPLNVTRSSAGNVVINQQRTSPPVIRSTPSVRSAPKTTINSAPVIRSPQVYTSRPIVRERIIERESGGGFLGNPFFWLYMSQQNNNSQPRQVIVQTPPQPQNTTVQPIIQKDDYNPGREFATFALGSGLTVLAMRSLARS